MNRPLELRRFRRCGCGEWCDVYVDADIEGPDVAEGNAEVFYEDRAKRLTDAELAAEYWQACAVLSTVLNLNEEYDLHDEAAMYATTLERFATHPHYDEETPDD